MSVDIPNLQTQVETTDAQAALRLTPEMIRLVTDKVMAILQNELRIEAERSRAFGITRKGA